MSECSIPVDPTNPGQVFACLGLMEAAEILCGPTTGCFDFAAGQDRFIIESTAACDPVDEVLGFLCGAEVRAATPDNAKAIYGKSLQFEPARAYPDGAYPYADPDARDRIPAVLKHGETQIVIDHWADGARRDAMKFWAGSGGYPGLALARDALELLPDDPAEIRDDPFSFEALQSSSFRFDWRRDYVPIDAGFSPNRHGSVSMVGYPVVELLAAIGLGRARPRRENRLRYRYAIWAMPLPLSLARAALGHMEPLLPGMSIRTFRMTMSWPGQEGQAKCITRVDEETTA